jgi:hypothetical protein
MESQGNINGKWREQKWKVKGTTVGKWREQQWKVKGTLKES